MPGRGKRLAMSPQKDVQRRTVSFSGQVQGVGFRYRTCHVARGFDIAGFVRNLSDGRVELVVEGELIELDRFIDAVRQEMGDYIRSFQVDSSPGTGEFHGFGIRN